ncbi:MULTISPECIES: hypothetical protein [unclassified Acinetobacter]|uniref:hypothetical protein n=1 Tax=unclassified Acinetobacter TaxID=196816 RepID=UPI002934A3FC|nr:MULTISPECIES: hypothetical protein [unclassified Acinetobacter]WOE31063.1 hypothetical protein QSG84_12040 [Acinetobacter sp. SAAs470]WOE39259.1 hypothetical protein QSG86_05705 [Acinetobacter sp. SAAs474]
MIKPDHDFSCGAVAMIALLNDDDQQNFIQQQLFSSIGQKDGPASFIDRQKVLNELDIQAQGYAISLHRLQQLQIPVISAINQDFVRLTHPSLGQKMRSVHPLKRIWLTHAIDGTKGKILLIVPKEVVLETPKNLVFFRTSQKFIAVDIFDHLRCSSIAPDMIFYDVTQKKSGIESQYLNESSNRFIDDKSLLNLLN